MNIYLLIFSLVVLGTHSLLYPANSTQFTYHGRYYTENGSVMYDWTCFKISFCFQEATKAVWNLKDTWNIYQIVIDGTTTKTIHPKKEKQITIFESGSPESHCIEIIKITENHYGPIASYKDSAFNGVELTGGKLLKKQESYNYRFQFMGDSLTTAFGVMGSRNPICFFNMKHIQNCRLSWATHLANKFSAEYRIEAVSGKGVMRNSLAVFGKRMPTLFTRITDNSKAFSYQYEDKYLPDILFLCIGHNDFANVKDPTPNNFLNAYREMLDMILNQQFKYFGRGTKIVSVCPMGLINEVCVLVKRAVEEYRYAYKWMYYLQIPQGAFDLKKDMGCDGHPNADGQRKFAQSLYNGVTNILSSE